MNQCFVLEIKKRLNISRMKFIRNNKRSFYLINEYKKLNTFRLNDRFNPISQFLKQIKNTFFY